MNEYQPDKRSSPWETVIEWAQERLSEDTVIGQKTARNLGQLTGTPPAFWRTRENQYRGCKKSDA